MSATVAAYVIRELVTQAANLGYDYAADVIDQADGTLLLLVRDLDGGDVKRFTLAITEIPE
jgi:hypothetical protein